MFTLKSLSSYLYFTLTTLAVILFIGCGNRSETSLQESIETFNSAFMEGNTAVLEQMITDDYQHTNGSSKTIGKTQWLDYLKKREQSIKSGEHVVNTYEMKDTQIQFYDKTAIVTATITTSSSTEGTTKKNSYRVTNVWVLENNGWKRAGFHDGRIE